MANTKISSLPTFTGDTTGVYLVMDNSGLTQTYKVSYETLFAKVSGLVDAGTFLTLDNLKATVSTDGSRGLSIASVSPTFYVNVSATYGSSGGIGGSSFNNGLVNTTPSSSLFSWNFVAEGDGATYLIFDKTNNRMYRVTMMIGPAYLNNFISIERLY